MGETVFQGAAALFLDGKGRMTVPSRHRDALKLEGDDPLTITKHTKRCLLILPRPAWLEFRAKLLALPLAYEDWRRIYLGSAMPAEIDSASRVLVPPELRSWAGFAREVMFMGVGPHFELWDQARYEAHESAAVAAGRPEPVRNLVIR